QQRAHRYKAYRTQCVGPHRDSLSERRPALQQRSCREWVGGVQGVSSWRISWHHNDSIMDGQDNPASRDRPPSQQPTVVPTNPEAYLGKVHLFETTETIAVADYRQEVC